MCQHKLVKHGTIYTRKEEKKKFLEEEEKRREMDNYFEY